MMKFRNMVEQGQGARLAMFFI